jgi:hypothetical protein
MKAESLTHSVLKERQVEHGMEIAHIAGTECST